MKIKAKLAAIVLVGVVVCGLTTAQTSTSTADTTAASQPVRDENGFLPVPPPSAMPDQVKTDATALTESPTENTASDVSATAVVQAESVPVESATPTAPAQTEAIVQTEAVQTEAPAQTASTEATTQTTSVPAESVPSEAPAVVAETPSTSADIAATPASAETMAAATQAAPAAPATPEPAVEDPKADLVNINLQDTQLTAAIETLARQANINYMLDPNISYGPVDERGGAKGQPTVTIRWENVTAEQALTALLNNYGLQLVEDPKTRIARITRKDPAAPDPLISKVIQLKYASPSNILNSVQSVLVDSKRSKVVADVRTSQLVVLATEKEHDAINQLLVRLDTPTKEVLIEAKILETTINPSTRKGIDWSGTLANQRVSFGNGLTAATSTTKTPGTTTPTTTTLPGGRTITSAAHSHSTTESEIVTTLGNVLRPGLSLNTMSGFSPETAFLNADGVSAVLSFLNTYADTKTISEPRMVTLDNEKASIDVGLLFPIVNTQAGTANTAGGSSISYSNLTVNLDVTPRITADNFVELKVQQSILKLGPTVASTVGDQANEVNSFFTRKIETAVLIPSGNTLVMGGLISDETGTANTKVPILGDIPGLGLLFRQDVKRRDRQNMIIFITPTIVQNTDFQPSQTTFLKTPAPTEQEKDWSAWDSGKPKDWSKKKKAAAK